MRGNEVERMSPSDSQHDCPQTCPVCTKPFLSQGTKSRPWSLKRCGHTFCYHCIEKFFESRRICPICNMQHSVAWKYDIERNRKELTGIVVNYTAEALVEWKNKQDSSPKAMKDAKVCWDCNLVYETNSIENFFQTHAEHRITNLSSLPEDIVKQLLWILKQLKEDNWSFSRTEVMLQGYLTFTENHLKHLRLVHSTMQTTKQTEVKNLTDDLKILCEEGPTSTKFKNKTLLDSIQEIWNFEVKDAKRHMQNLIQAKVLPSSIDPQELLSDLERVTSPIIPTGINEKYVHLMPRLDLKYLETEVPHAEKTESQKLSELEDAPLKICIPAETHDSPEGDIQGHLPPRRTKTHNSGKTSLCKRTNFHHALKKSSTSSARKRTSAGNIKIKDVYVAPKVEDRIVNTLNLLQPDPPKSPLLDYLELDDSDYVIDTDMDSMLASIGTQPPASTRNTKPSPAIVFLTSATTHRSTSNSNPKVHQSGQNPTTVYPSSDSTRTALTQTKPGTGSLRASLRSASISNPNLAARRSNQSRPNRHPSISTSNRPTANADSKNNHQERAIPNAIASRETDPDDEPLGLGKRPEYRLEVVEDDADFDLDGVEFLRFSMAIDAAEHRLDEAIHSHPAVSNFPN